MTAPSTPITRPRDRAAAGRPLPGTLAVALPVVSVADVLTTAVALSWGMTEVSPGGALALATAGLAGLVVLKLLAVALVWALRRGWPVVGGAVGWGLVAMTAGAVAWNLLVLGATPPAT